MYSFKTNAPIYNDGKLAGFQFGNRNQNSNQKTIASSQLGIQAKLRMGSVDDPAEKEADRMADQVIRMPDGQLEPMPTVRSLHNGQESVYLSCVAGRNSVAKHGAFKPVFQCQRMLENRGAPQLPGFEQSENANFPAPTSFQRRESEIENRTGMPTPLKVGLEALASTDLSGIRVHTNSTKPAQLNALVFTQGQDIHMATGQDQHLPHEGWHVVQQMQGRVKPTVQAKVVAINDHAGLEREADVMGAKAMQERHVCQNVSKATVPDPRSQSQKLGSPSVTEQSLPNGAIRQTIHLPFSQVISRVASPETDTQEASTHQEEPLVIDNMPLPEVFIASNRDSVSSTLTLVPTTTRGGVAIGATDFGITASSFSVDNLVITSGAGTFTVTADIVQTTTWDVRSGTGPLSQVDIASDTDANITTGTYALVASDLTPDMSSDNGRPPRTAFWAEDLTIVHELFHTTQHVDTFGPDAVTATQTWLDGQTAASDADVRALLPDAWAEFGRVINAFAVASSTEEDAYGDGASLYKARADSIKAKGDAGSYP